MQRAGFPMGAEPLVALDLVDTLITVTEPATDLIADPAQAAEWWQLQAGRLPEGPAPDAAATGRLRAAIRDLFDAHLERRRVRQTACASRPTDKTSRLKPDGTPSTAETPRWPRSHARPSS
jgi:Putative stress-induced transcription regulator